jgi:hypothetical protein
MSHVQHVPNRLDLTFSKFDIIPARPHNQNIDAKAFTYAGFTYKPDGKFEMMKSPIGHTEWCQAFA